MSNMSTTGRTSLTRLDKIKINRKRSVVCQIQAPLPLTLDDVEPLLRNWRAFCESAGPDGINNSFSYLLVQHPEVYWEYFRNAPSISVIDDSPNNALKSGKLNRHNKNIHKVLDNCVKFALTNDLGTVESTLRRLGAYHAEFQVTGLLLLNFEPCLLWSMDTADQTITAHNRLIWQRLFEYITRNMIMGINNYNDKVISALTHKKVTLHNTHWCGKCHICGGQQNDLEIKRSYSTASISDHK